jgi:hypothetical protein
MMGVQGRTNLTNAPFIRHGRARMYQFATLAQDVGRTGNLVPYTLMAQKAADGQWVPFSNPAAIDGTQYPTGISYYEVAEADIQAGVVTPFSVYKGGGSFSFDEAQLVFEGAHDLDTIITAPTNLAITVREWLTSIGMNPVAVDAKDGYENA